MKTTLNPELLAELQRATQAANAKAGRKAQRAMRLRALQRRAHEGN